MSPPSHSPATNSRAQRLALLWSLQSLSFKEKVDPFPEETTRVGGGGQPGAKFRLFLLRFKAFSICQAVTTVLLGRA